MASLAGKGHGGRFDHAGPRRGGSGVQDPHLGRVIRCADPPAQVRSFPGSEYVGVGPELSVGVLKVRASPVATVSPETEGAPCHTRRRTQPTACFPYRKRDRSVPTLERGAATGARRSRVAAARPSDTAGRTAGAAGRTSEPLERTGWVVDRKRPSVGSAPRRLPGSARARPRRPGAADLRGSTPSRCPHTDCTDTRRRSSRCSTPLQRSRQ